MTILKLNNSKINNSAILFKVLLRKRKLIKNPLVSPIYGDLSGLPPILINVGEFELLRDDSILFADKVMKLFILVLKILKICNLPYY